MAQLRLDLQNCTSETEQTEIGKAMMAAYANTFRAAFPPPPGQLAEWVKAVAARLLEEQNPPAAIRSGVEIRKMEILSTEMSPKPDQRGTVQPPPCGSDMDEPDQHLTKWEDFEIRFTSDERVQITVAGQHETRNYSEMGFEDKRSRKPNLAWQTLRLLAEKRGIIHESSNKKRDWPRVEKRIQEIRKTLRELYKIPDDPLPYVKGTGYRARLQISCSPSYQT